MEYKPTVTYSFSESGDENLFLTLSTHLRKILQNHPVKWKRSYGRTAHKLSLDVKFLPLTSALLKRNDLVTRPYFHVFWTDCNDIDFYRSSVKSEIASWLSELIGNEIFDWLIVVVTGDGATRSNKPKLSLPRSSLADKIKADFCAKSPERMHVLQDPMKDSSKTTDSWSSLATKLANFTVLCLEDAVTKYEDRVRAERERRNEKSWNFCSYFIMQEELAFMFEMLCLYEEALIQYNELDAMFTQYLLNAHAGDVAHWLSSFTSSVTRWRSLSLWRRIDDDARQMLVEDNATLIDVRNYLFARHCHLLFAIGDMKRVTELMHNFLHSTILELDILEIELPHGAKECWVFMSCIELTQTLERNRKNLQNSKRSDANLSEMDYMKMSNDDLRLEIANLWDLARQKLIKLAELCGLMPDVETSSEDLQTVVDLIAGMGEEEERDGLAKSPSLILREAISSKENFRNQYLELSELAMGTYKHTGRFRSARNIGKDLAEFYMRSNEPEKAESFLLDSVRTFSNESWLLLATNASEKLAECYKQLCNVRRYIRLCCALMCDKYVSEKKRGYFCDELHSHSTDFGDHSLPILLAVFANVTAVQFVPSQTTFQYNSSPHILLHIRSDAPKTIHFHSVQLSLRYQDASSNDSSANLSHTEVLEEEEMDVFSYATFSSDEEEDEDAECISLGKDRPSDSSRLSVKKAAMQKNRVHRKRRFVSSSSYDSIFAIQQKTTLGLDGMIQLVTMEEPFSQPSKCMANTLPPRIKVTFESETKNEEVLWAGITCRSAHQLLRRQDSYQSLRSIHASATNIVMEEYEDLLETKQVSIKPGDNVLRVKIDTSKAGDFTLRQLRFTMNKIHFVLPRILPVITYAVTREQPTLTVDHQPRIFCNTKQSITIEITSGDYKLGKNDDRSLAITLPKRLRVCSIKVLTVETEEGVKTEHMPPDIKVVGSKGCLQLPPIEVHSTVKICLCCIYGQPDTAHDLEYRSHRRTHSAPPSTVRKPSHALTREYVGIRENEILKVAEDSLEKGRYPSGKNSASPASNHKKIGLSKLNGRSGESPVKKFLTFVREVADRVESKTTKTEAKENDLIKRTIMGDDFLEVTLEDTLLQPNGKVVNFEEGSKKDYDITSQDINESYFGSGVSNTNETICVNSFSSIKKSSSLSAKHGTSRSDINLQRHNVNGIQAHDEAAEDDSKIICNVSFCLPWDDLPPFSTSIPFNRLLEFSHGFHRFYSTLKEDNNVVHRIVSISVSNMSQNTLVLENHCLRFVNCSEASVSSLVARDKKEVKGHQSLTFAWRVLLTSAIPARCNVQFNVDVSNGVDEVTPSTYKFDIENIQTIYVVSTEIGEKGSQLVCGEMTTLKVNVKRNRSDPDHEHTRSGQQLLMFQVIDTRGRWAVCGKSTGILSLPLLPAVDRDSESDDCMATTTLEVMPLIGGLLHRPDVVLQRYLKRRSSEFDETLSSTESPVLKPPRLIEFKPGEVLNTDEYKQVRVLNTVGEQCK